MIVFGNGSFSCSMARVILETQDRLYYRFAFYSMCVWLFFGSKNLTINTQPRIYDGPWFVYHCCIMTMVFKNLNISSRPCAFLVKWGEWFLMVYSKLGLPHYIMWEFEHVSQPWSVDIASKQVGGITSITHVLFESSFPWLKKGLLGSQVRVLCIKLFLNSRGHHKKDRTAIYSETRCFSSPGINW